MKLVLLLVALVAVCTIEAIPAIPRDNSHYVEGVSQYIWMPDGKGELQLVDLHENPQEEMMKARNAGNNNQYWLYTRQNQNNFQRINHGDINSLRSSNYNGNRPLVVIVHGWQNNGYTEMNSLISSASLNIQDVNVIVVDWGGAAGGLYNPAAAAVPSVGQALGNFIVWLINNGGGNWNNVHLIGFSLGAHVVGNAGRTAGRRCGRITGLDPAGPQWGGNSNALNANDAQYVEAIHTNGQALGIMNAIGRTNFYPNGGRNQPGCGANVSCSHGRATELMAATIRFNHLNGRQCSNIQQAQNVVCSGSTLRMGNGLFNKRANAGIYAMATNSNWPF